MIDTCELWHKRARPVITEKGFNVTLGVHFEEVAEMVETLRFHVDGHESCDGDMTMLYTGLKLFADRLKSGEATATISNRKELLDALADQMVTAIGVGYMAGMKPVEAFAAVNSSNWSKFEDGQPVLKDNGKIGKGRDYREPNLEGMY